MLNVEIRVTVTLLLTHRYEATATQPRVDEPDHMFRAGYYYCRKKEKSGEDIILSVCER